MVLASQTPRSSNRWRSMTNERQRRSRATRRVVLLTLVVGAISVGAWAFWGRGGGEGALHDGPATEDNATTDAAAPPPRDARPVLDLGGGSRDAAPARPSTSDPAPAPRSAAKPPPAEPRGTTPEPRAPATDAGTSSTPSRTGSDATTAPPASGTTAPPASGTRRPTSPEPLAAALALAKSDPVAARRTLTAMAIDPRLSPAERSRAREAIDEINREILFSPKVVPGDPFARTYVVQSGDNLARIAQREGLDADWRFVKRINRIADERRLRPGQTLKLVKGPFHAVVSKRDYRMDVFLGEGPERVLAASFLVGLGEYNSTPTGRFKVRPRSRLANPAWTNPRTGEHFRADDPKNPIGEHWIGIMGIDEHNKGVEAYGIHGTIEPDSIGRQASMGCVRMRAADVELVYELLTEPNSTITIVE
ncbi:MAG TPA: L,D-transpeptidase family protein [Phycisphaerales bacterium]|nr:L,D-transpeptidase family protein [Phycisphaerales bacterium]HMP38529.1 L,D-transpeptidase family protein [Phycisphaerales bacterium]